MHGRNNTHGVETAGATVSYEARLWPTAEALRSPLDAAGYKHVALCLIFLKYTSDALEEHREPLLRGSYAEPEDPDGYRAADVFWVRHDASWPRRRGGPVVRLNAAIGQLVDDAMAAIERNNPGLKTVLPKEYARPALDKGCLSQ
ncbi:MAG: type I restriction-modification system subunit M N-terminal domain-containing protein, partial [Candidatus Oleimicrobiaceae bacterium]